MPQVSPLSRTRCLRGAIGFQERGSFFHYWWEIRRWASRHYFISNPVMFCNCVSSTVTRKGIIPIDVKNSCFSKRALPFGVVDRDTKPPNLYFALILNSFGAIWCPGAWMGEQTIKFQLVEQTMRDVGRVLSHRGRFSLRPWNFSLSRACWIVFCERFEKPSCAILEQRSWKTWQFFGFSPVSFETRPLEERT